MYSYRAHFRRLACGVYNSLIQAYFRFQPDGNLQVVHDPGQFPPACTVCTRRTRTLSVEPYLGLGPFIADPRGSVKPAWLAQYSCT